MIEANSFSFSSGGFYAALDTSGSLMLFAGEQDSYGYLGFSADGYLNYLKLGMIFTAFQLDPGSFFCDAGCDNPPLRLTLTGDVDVIYGRECNVPIPGAIWLLGSGLLGLVGIRRRKGQA